MNVRFSPIVWESGWDLHPLAFWPSMGLQKYHDAGDVSVC